MKNSILIQVDNVVLEETFNPAPVTKTYTLEQIDYFLGKATNEVNVWQARRDALTGSTEFKTLQANKINNVQTIQG